MALFVVRPDFGSEELGMAEPVVQTKGEGVADKSSPEAMLEMILMKEDEIKQRIRRAETEAQRMVEEAKLDAAHRKRESTSEEVGSEIRERELAKARQEADRVSREIAAEAERIRKKGMENVDEAIRIVIEGVLPARDE